MSENIYIPPNVKSLAEETELPQIRLGIQGPSNVGKTWASLTFPNPIIIPFDRGHGAHIGRADVLNVKMYDPDFVRKYANDSEGIVNRKHALIKWIKSEGTKLTSNQTLILDALVGIQEAFEEYEDKHPTYSSKTGKKDDYAAWKNKIIYFGELMTMLKSLKCHIILISHETPDRGTDGELNGKLRPILTGQFGDQLRSHFTDWVRAHATNKPTEDKIQEKALPLWKFKDKKQFMDMLDSFGGSDYNTFHYWQLSSDSLCDCKTSSLVNYPHYIPARFNDFKRFMRQPITTTTQT